MLSQQFFNPKGLTTIDKTYDLFSLIDMAAMSATDRSSVILDLQMLIWTDFLKNRLPLLLTREQLMAVQQELASGKKIDELLNEIEKFVPNLLVLWLEFSIDFRLNWIKQYWTNRYQEIYAQLKTANKNSLPMLEPLVTKAHKAQILAENEKWAELGELFKNPETAG